jgi:hypothetical protein
MTRAKTGSVCSAAILLGVAGTGVPSFAWAVVAIVCVFLIFLAAVIFIRREVPFNRLRALIRDLTGQNRQDSLPARKSDSPERASNR